jgi:hypothetical protein
MPSVSEKQSWRQARLSRRWEFCDQQGEVLCSIDLKKLCGDAGPCIGIEHTELQRVHAVGCRRYCRLSTSITYMA